MGLQHDWGTRGPACAFLSDVKQDLRRPLDCASSTAGQQIGRESLAQFQKKSISNWAPRGINLEYLSGTMVQELTERGRWDGRDIGKTDGTGGKSGRIKAANGWRS